jgi:hypothetical protein
VAKQWAFYDEEGEVVRFVSYPAEGASPYPPLIKQLDPDDPEWENPLF